MISQINLILTPLESFIKSYRKYIGYFFIVLSLLSFGFFWIDDGLRESGEKALLVLWIILWIPIFAKVFGIRIFQMIMPLRQELGILMGALVLVHGMLYIVPDPSVVGESYFWFDDTTVISFLAFGFLAFCLTIPLMLTSSKWVMRLMGKYWKLLHRTVYGIVILSVIHVVFLNWYREFEIGPLLILIAYFGFKILEWRGFAFLKKNNKKIYPKGQKWLCVPCGYIYDPAIGDEADGIKAGTEFGDIPDSWRCPECGVTKADFVPLEDTLFLLTGYQARVVEKTFLNPVTLKLVIELDEDQESIPGQFAVFMWSDSEGEFTRSYSIAEHTGRQLTFLIKLGEFGRGASILRNISVNAKIRIRGISGKFSLHNSESPKIFIATGTGLAPIYNMIRALPETIDKSLYFSVATSDELFYISELKAIPHVNLQIHITREKVPECYFGRVNVDDIVATLDTEWYICGSPKMVEEAISKLKTRGFENIYSEEFN